MCVCVCVCVCVCLQTELTDCISMLVGNNGRIQGIISQLEESCRAVEVRSVCGCVCVCVCVCVWGVCVVCVGVCVCVWGGGVVCVSQVTTLRSDKNTTLLFL